MAVYTVSVLGSGQLTIATGALYTVTAPVTQAIISKIVLVNSGTTATRNVNLYVSVGGGADRRIIPLDMPLEEDYSFVFGGALTLSVTDAIRGDAAAATEIDYTIYGVEVV